MKLDDMIELAGLKPTDPKSHKSNSDILGISADSRQIKLGFVFFALSGSHAKGADFIADAIRQGAIAVVADGDDIATDGDVPLLKSENARLALALTSAKFYPNRPAKIVAVTGTAGKTSVASFVRQIWDFAGEQAAMIGTTGVVSPKGSEYGNLTTPDSVALHKLLDQLSHGGVTHCSMEASSHGLDQYRLDGVELAAGAFTNLGRDHMDYHPTIEHYLDAKLALFRRVLPNGAHAVIFADDEYSQATISAAETAGNNVLSVGRNGEYLTVKRVEQLRYNQRAEIMFDGQLFSLDLPLAGDFQLSNALVAAGLCLSTGTSAETVFKALAQIKGAPGRLELIGKSNSGAPVYVDYAHKPDALEQVLKAVRPFTTGRIVLVFGCGGDRDKGKRPIMGEIAQRLSDISIVTDDNPRREDAVQIRSEILKTAPDAIEIAGRGEAIRHAVKMLEEGDTLVIAGKGHEEGQLVGDKVLPFSDHKEALQAIGQAIAHADESVS